MILGEVEKEEKRGGTNITSILPIKKVGKKKKEANQEGLSEGNRGEGTKKLTIYMNEEKNKITEKKGKRRK